jgi:hypothetical protein
MKKAVAGTRQLRARHGWGRHPKRWVDQTFALLPLLNNNRGAIRECYSDETETAYSTLPITKIKF